MKKAGIIALVVSIMIAACGAFAFADEGSLTLKSSYPKDGQKNTSIENVGMKLYFSNSVSDDATKKHNEGLIKIVDMKGKKIPARVLTADNKSGLVLVLANNTDSKHLVVKSNTEYKVVIDKSFMDDQGNMLGRNEEISFRTYNQKMNMSVNFIMMGLMFGGIIVISVRQQAQKQAEDAAEGKKEKKDGAFNPYREAKKTGKSVDEVIKEEQRRKAKKDRKVRKAEKKNEEMREKLEAKLDLSAELPYVYKVSKRRPISAAGGTYKSGLGKSSQQSKPESGKKRGKNNRTGSRK